MGGILTGMSTVKKTIFTHQRGKEKIWPVIWEQKVLSKTEIEIAVRRLDLRQMKFNFSPKIHLLLPLWVHTDDC